MAAVILKLVADDLAHGTLAAIRSLGRIGVPVTFIGESPRIPPARSRWVSRRIAWPATPDPGEDLVDMLSRLGRTFPDRPFLLPVDDVGALFVQDHVDCLAEIFRFPRLPEGLARDLADKARLHGLCQRAGVPDPVSVFPRSAADAATLAGELGYPVVVKSMDPRLLRGRPGAKSVAIAEDEAQLSAIYEAGEDESQPNFMLQEFIPGDPQSVWMFNGYFDFSSACLIGFCGQKVRQYPVGTGATSLGICRDNPDVRELACRFLGGVGYRGIVDMGFRLDRRSGEYKLLDVNPRMGATFRLFVGRAGGDVVRAEYLDLTGEEVLPDTAPDGRHWVAEANDLRTFLAEHREGRITTRQWLRSLSGVDEWAWLSWDDPLPALAALVSLAPGRSSRPRQSRAT